MKSIRWRWLVLLVCLLAAQARAGVSKGDNVCVQDQTDWRWYAATVVETGTGDSVKVHYVGYDESMDSWVSADVFWAPGVFKAGDSVWVQWKGVWFSAVVLSDGDQVQVHYRSDGQDSTNDEWVSPCSVYPAPLAGDPVWAKPVLSDWSYGQFIAETGVDLWNVHVGGYTNWGSWKEFDDELGPGKIMPPTPAEAAEILAAFESHQPAPMPRMGQIFSYAPVQQPEVSNVPSNAKPIGVGTVATGGGQFDLAISLPPFDAKGDIYFGLGHIGWGILFYGQDGAWHSISEGLNPFKSNFRNIYGLKQTFFQNVEAASLPEGDYDFYLIFTPAGQLDAYYLWTSSLSVSNKGQVTGNPLQCGVELSNSMAPLIQAVEAAGDKAWYDKVKQYVANYKDDEGNPDTQGAYYELIWAAYLSDNVYPFCWASLNAVQNAPEDPLALNSAVTCLCELDQIDLAGRLLDCAVAANPEFPLSWDNAAYYLDKKGNVDEAIAAKKKALGDGSSTGHPYAAWDGYHYAQSKGRSDAAHFFDQHLPSNYELLKSDGTTGSGAPVLKVCCGCNDKFYNSVTECVGECSASLSCFTNICTANQMCCGLNGVFGLEAGVCYPPVGIQSCVEVDSDGNFTIKTGANVVLLEAYLGASTNFKNNHNVFVEAKALSTQKAKVILLTSNPKEQRLGASFSPNKDWEKKAFGKRIGVSVGLNVSHDKWLRAMICVASTAQ